MKTLLLIYLSTLLSVSAALTITNPRCEYRVNPLGIDEAHPRLSWELQTDQQGVQQSAYRIRVSSEGQSIWDSGKVESDQNLHVEYQGEALVSRQVCEWQVEVWAGDEHAKSKAASWSMGLLKSEDWQARYISYKDDVPFFTDKQNHYLPAARQYRKTFSAAKKIKRATAYATALGIYELHLNGQRVTDTLFAPGWTDYHQRAYYYTYDITDMIQSGDNAMGAWVAEGWYSGYVAFGLLVGIGTEQIGRYTYGKTPSVRVQIELEYEDGTREIFGTDRSWKVTGDGPIQQADLLMGEFYDARKEQAGWATTTFDDANWTPAIFAEENGNPTAQFWEYKNPEAGGGPKKQGEPRDFGFKAPPILEAFPGVPARVVEEIPAISVTEREPGTFMFNLGQNFAGAMRLNIKGPAGHQVTIRYGEMLHPDGRLMTENLRRARATDYYVCKGDPNGEVYEPRFTFHGFQYVEVANFPGKARKDTVTGLVMQSDTPLTSTFECSDPMVNQLFKNVVWTQRANFLDLPTDCPQRDERMGWTGDAQVYVATATYNADVAAFYTKWMRELMESQRPSGAFPGYAPFPFQHGWDFGSAWADAGIICPWTIWQAYGDTRIIERCWEPMTRFMEWRKRTSKDDLGIAHGNGWGDWLAQGASTPLEYVDTAYFAISADMMAEMADAIGKPAEARKYREQFARTQKTFVAKYLKNDGRLAEKSQTAYALALQAKLIPADQVPLVGKQLAALIGKNGNHMATGFLGTRPLLPVLSASGQHGLAAFLLQSHEFPSWGYEVDQGATTIWERWDSYTKEDAFGRHNAAMNSFSHYSFGAVCEWMFRTLAGIDSAAPGYKKIVIKPMPPPPGSNAQHKPIDWVKASYQSIHGLIRSEWRIEGSDFHLTVEVPVNTTANVYVPSKGLVLQNGKTVKLPRMENGFALIEVGSGTYAFVGKSGVVPTTTALKTSVPADLSINPDEIDLSSAKQLITWDFSSEADRATWTTWHNTKAEVRDGKTFLVGTGPDPQITINLPKSLTGPLAIAIKARPAKGTTAFLFYANPGKGYNGQQQVNRALRPSKNVNTYLFKVTDPQPIQKLRFDPFADPAELEIESITIYGL